MNNIFFLLILFRKNALLGLPIVALVFAGCHRLDENLPLETKVDHGPSLPIDGIWNDTRCKIGAATFRFEGKCVYSLDTNFAKYGAVIISDLQMIDRRHYRGTQCLTDIFTGKPIRQPVVFELITPTELLESITMYPDDKNSATVQTTYKLISADNPKSLAKAVGNTDSRNSIPEMRIKQLDSEETKEECGREIIFAPSEAHHTESIDQSVELSNSNTLGGTVEASGGPAGSLNLFGLDASVVAQLRASIHDDAESRFAMTLSTESKNEIWAKLSEADQATSSKWEIIWYKRGRNGIAEYNSPDGLKTIPFKIITGLEYDKIPLDQAGVTSAAR